MRMASPSRQTHATSGAIAWGCTTPWLESRKRQPAISRTWSLLPAVPDSHWVAAAQRFLDIYQSPANLYQACVQAEACDPRRALAALIEAIPLDEYPNAQAAIWQAGVSQRSSGYFDFDGDDVKESWFTVRHRTGEKLELWIVMPYEDGVKAIFVDSLDSNLPTVSYYDDEEYPPTVLIDDTIAIRIERTPGNLLPYLSRPVLPQLYPDRFQDAVDAAREALLSGADPKEVYQELVLLEKFPGLLCRARWSCDEYYYLLGLAAELAKNPNDAIEAFLYLWRNYSRSPFTTMARLKLVWTGVTPTPTTHRDPCRNAHTDHLRHTRNGYHHAYGDQHAVWDRRYADADIYSKYDSLPGTGRHTDPYPLSMTSPACQPQTWRVIYSPPASGAWNMAVDEAILEGVANGKSPPTLRLYAWDPPCLSLGYAQPISDVDLQALKSHGWQLVRRPTGGRAILHTDELTYSIIGRQDDPRLAGSVVESYQRLSQALLRALQSLGIPAIAEANPALPAGSDPKGPVCFEVPSTYEITY